MKVLAPMTPRSPRDALLVAVVRLCYRSAVLLLGWMLLGSPYASPVTEEEPRHTFPIEVVEVCPCDGPHAEEVKPR